MLWPARFWIFSRPLLAFGLSFAAACVPVPASDDFGTASFTLPGGASTPGAQGGESWTAVTAPSLPSSLAGGSPISKPTGLMWKATLAKNTVYLLGSLHAASPELYPLPKPIEAAFLRSSVLLVEVDINRITSAQTSKLMSSYALYDSGDSLWNHVSSETKKVIESIWCRTGASCDAVAKLRPWALALVGSRQPTGMSAALGIDRYFLDRAEGHIRIGEMESADAQLKMFADLPDSQQEAFLMDSIRGAQLERQYLLELQAAWLSGDARRMETLMNWAFRDTAAMEQTVLGDRNLHMADVVEQCLRNGQRAFAVMGAFHLLGNDGVIRLLQDRGYRVEQVLPAN